MKSLLRDAWDRFLLLFPLVSMGLLALGTYWLVRSTPPSTGAVAARMDFGGALLSLTARGAWVYAGGADGAVYGWRPDDGQRRVFAAGHPRWVHGVEDTAPTRLVSWRRT